LEIRNVNPEKIKPGTVNPREDLKDLDELSENIRYRQELGQRPIYTPLMVREIEDEIFDYEVIDGKRRLQASLMIRLPEVPIVLDTEFEDEKDLKIASLISNEFREDFNWIEKAKAYKELSDLGMTHEEIGKRVGLSRSRVTKYINTYEKWIALKGAPAHILEMETTTEIVNKCPEEDIPELVEYVKKNEISRDEIRKVLYALKNFYATLNVLEEYDRELYDELYKKYYPHRFRPEVLSIYDDEKKLRNPSETFPTIDVIIPIDKYPTLESAEAYVRSRRGEVIQRVTKDGWLVHVVKFTLNELEDKFRKVTE